MLSLATFPTLAAIGVFLIILALSRYVSLGSVCAAAAVVPAQILIHRAEAFKAQFPLTIFVALVALAVILRHLSNMKRLLAGEEPKIGGGKTFSRSAREEG